MPFLQEIGKLVNKVVRLRRMPSLRSVGVHLSYLLLSSGYTPPPRSIVMELTDRCNLRCRMCWLTIEAEMGIKREFKDELTLAEIERFIDEVKDFKPEIMITGGEPLTRKEFPRIIAHIARYGLTMLVITNGVLLTEDLADQIVKSKVRKLCVSIDGDEETHDRIRGVKGTYQRAIRGIKLLQEAKTRLHSDIPEIALTCTITRDNLHCLESVIDTSAELGGIKIQYKPLIWVSEDQFKAHKKFLDDRCSLNDDMMEGFKTDLFRLDIELLLEKYRSIRQTCEQKSIPVAFFQLPDEKALAEWYSNPGHAPDTYCMDPYIAARLGPNGDLRFCQFINYMYGNIREKPFRRIWNSKKARNMRALIRKCKLFPGCTKCCHL